MPRKWLTRPGYLSPEFSSHRKAPKASFEEICLKSRLGAGQDGQRSPLNPALSRQRQADLSVSSRPACPHSSRTAQRPCLIKPEKKNLRKKEQGRKEHMILLIHAD